MIDALRVLRQLPDMDLDGLPAAAAHLTDDERCMIRDACGMITDVLDGLADANAAGWWRAFTQAHAQSQGGTNGGTSQTR